MKHGVTLAATVIAILFAAGCIVGEGGTGDGTGGGDGSGSGTGGGGGNGTGGGTVDELDPDAGMGSGTVACTGAAYDPCNDASQCLSGQCQLFQQAGIQVCTQTCTPGDATTCPTQNGQPQQCNNNGLCRPAAANSCTR